MIGVIVEGLGEINAIQHLLTKIDKTTGLMCRPLRADLQPKANSRVIARSAKGAINQLVSRGVKKVVVLIDREDHPCAVSFASDLSEALHDLCCSCQFAVVVKNNSIVNWVLADLNALISMTSRFSVTEDVRRAVSNRADELPNPVRMLDKCAVKFDYHKGQDPAKIAAKMDLIVASKNSRSFRKFMREVGDRRYQSQSKDPIESRGSANDLE